MRCLEFRRALDGNAFLNSVTLPQRWIRAADLNAAETSRMQIKHKNMGKVSICQTLIKWYVHKMNKINPDAYSDFRFALVAHRT